MLWKELKGRVLGVRHHIIRRGRRRQPFFSKSNLLHMTFSSMSMAHITGEIMMITALIQFILPQPITRENARMLFSDTAPKYREIPGLIRKYYLLSQDGGTAGGVYLWHSQEDAERLYTDAWKKFIRDKYGAEPSVTYFESPVVVDNAVGEIITDA